MHIRALQLQDMPLVIALGRRMHEESAYAFLPFNQQRAQLLALQTMNEPTFFGRVAVQNDEIIGMFAAHIGPYFFSDSLIASDLIAYVLPKYRGGRAFIMLVRAYIMWAQAKNAAEIQLSVTTQIETKKTEQLFSRLGFARIGAVYKKQEA